MKIDMHCHVKEGSIDSRVSMEEYIQLLQSKGFGGMVITETDTYNGYRFLEENPEGIKYTDFKVFKGVEYDTIGARHILVIVQDDQAAHSGAARCLLISLIFHRTFPMAVCSVSSSLRGKVYRASATGKNHRRDPKIVEQFDFVEVFNACEG